MQSVRTDISKYKNYRIMVDIKRFGVYNIAKEKRMKELIEMSEAHLLNVKQQIEQLSAEVQRLTEYFEEGVKVLDSYRTESQETASSVEDASSSI